MATYFYYLIIYYLVIIVNCHELYTNYNLESDALCSIQKRRIRLGRGIDSGILIKQIALNSHPDPWLFNYKCNFTIDASSNRDGIFAVIQSLSFRKNDVTGECIDYLQFTGSKEPTRRYCGVLGVNLTPLETFVEPKGILHVQVNIDREALKPNERAELRLVFTAYSDCYRAEEQSMPCIPEQAAGCIWGRYWNDRIPNCPSQDCIDEGGCEGLSNFLEPPHPPDSAPVTLGAITTILLCLLLFMTCFWACKKHQICCWGPHCTEDNTTQTNRDIIHTPTVQPVIELHEPLPSSVNPSPSAPELDKDKPPAYETLFPDR